MSDDEHIIPNNTNNTVIENIVIAGGGINGFSYYGILKESEKRGVWNINNIKSIWGTSAGSMLAVLIALNHEWDTIDDYLIDRPWDIVFKLNIYSLISAFNTCGIFDGTQIIEIFKPLFISKKVDINITMKDFYNITNIDIHIIITNANTFKLVDVSYKTHPDWKVVDAVIASSSIPILFKPCVINNQLYCDGCFNSNYPINYCIESGISADTIMGVCPTMETGVLSLDNDPTLFDYIIYIILFIVLKFIHNTIQPNINTEYKIQSASLTMKSLTDTIYNKSERELLIQSGCYNVIDQINNTVSTN
jgi:predicted acylesterase/phospholipase RssA